jgi:hypothetical protein
MCQETTRKDGCIGTNERLVPCCDEDVQATSYSTSNCLYWTVFAPIALDIQKQMGDMSMGHASMPGGLMSILQPGDVSVNKLLKNYVQRFYSEWMATGP